MTYSLHIKDALLFLFGLLQECLPTRFRRSSQLLPGQTKAYSVQALSLSASLRSVSPDQAIISTSGCKNVSKFLVVDALEQHTAAEEVLFDTTQWVDVYLGVDAKAFRVFDHVF